MQIIINDVNIMILSFIALCSEFCFHFADFSHHQSAFMEKYSLAGCSLDVQLLAAAATTPPKLNSSRVCLTKIKQIGGWQSESLETL